MGARDSLRTRWAAIGAACAVTLGGGTIGVVRAVQGTGERATYVPVTPARVLDTRTDIGAADIVDATPVLLTITGSIPTTTGTATVVPVGASGVVVNVTAVNPSVGGFVSLRPGDAVGAPAVSTLNVTANGIFPNGATLTLPTSGPSAGQVQIWFEGDGTGGRTDMLIDIVGYFTDHNHDDRYYTEAEVATALSDKVDETDLVPYPITPNAFYWADITAGDDSGITVLGDGRVAATFYRELSGDLMYLLCNNESCSSNLIVAIETSGLVGIHSSIATGWDGFATVAYRDFSNGDLWVLDCSDAECSARQSRPLDTAGAVGHYPSIAINPSGNPVISYIDESNSALKLAVCLDPTCSTSILRTVDDLDMIGFGTSIAIGANGYPVISYIGGFPQPALKLAACLDATCTTSTTTTIDEGGTMTASIMPSLTIGANGMPLIAASVHRIVYELVVVSCADSTCGTYTVNSLGVYGQHPSIKVSSAGLPLISSYENTSQDLQVTACSIASCALSMTATIDHSGNVGLYSQMAMNFTGFPTISYFDYSNTRIKVATVPVVMMRTPFGVG